jgi:hypothetical protein
MSHSSTLAFFDFTMQKLEPKWRGLFLVGLGTMTDLYSKAGTASIGLINEAPMRAVGSISIAAGDLVWEGRRWMPKETGKLDTSRDDLETQGRP